MMGSRTTSLAGRGVGRAIIALLVTIVAGAALAQEGLVNIEKEGIPANQVFDTIARAGGVTVRVDEGIDEPLLQGGFRHRRLPQPAMR